MTQLKYQLKPTQMKKAIFILAAVCALTACQNSPADLMPDESGVREMVSSNPHRVTLAQALQNAEKMLGNISEQKTRSASQHIVKSVDYMVNHVARSANDVDTMLYLVNYTDGGFALLGADTRIPRVFAVSDEGSLAWNDTINNPGLGQWLSNVTGAIPMFIPDPGVIVIPTPGPGGAKSYLYEKCAPRLNKNVKKWGQDDPYNQYCKTTSGATAKTGCGALSVAMVMSYYEWPTIVDGYAINWSIVKNGTATSGLKRLIAKIGSSANLAATYGVSNTSNESDDVHLLRTFRNLGYTTSASFNNLSFSIVKSLTGRTYKYVYNPSGEVDFTDYSIAGQPIYTIGTTSANQWHAWVIDGWMIYDVTADIDKSDPSIGDGPFYENYIHCVWGWDGDNNGYYLASVPLKLGGVPDKYDDDDDPNAKSMSQYVFTKNLKCFGKVTPNK